MGSTGALNARGVGECREHAYGIEWTALHVRAREWRVVTRMMHDSPVTWRVATSVRQRDHISTLRVSEKGRTGVA